MLLLDIPIVHTITAKVSFQNFKKNYKSDPLLFRIPPNYTEENIQETLFKDVKKESSPTSSTTANPGAAFAPTTSSSTTQPSSNEFTTL